MPEAYIVDAVRSPVGKRNGGLAGVHPADLGAHSIRALMERVDVENPQQPRLHVWTDAADFVKKASAALSFLKNSLFVCQCSGKRPPDVAKQFTFENGLGKRSAVYGDKGTVGSRAVLMNRLSN